MSILINRRELDPTWWAWIEARHDANVLSDYALALSLEMAAKKGKTKLAENSAATLRSKAVKVSGTVHWKTAGFTRWMEDPHEITAAVLKALVTYDINDPLIDGILGYFAATKRGDRWNSTKDTALILFAMCEYLAKANYTPDGNKAISLGVNGKAKQAVKFDDGLTHKVSIPMEHLKIGKNQIEFDTAMSGVMYRVVFTHWKAGGEVAPQANGITVTRKFFLIDDKKQLKELKSGDNVARGSYIVSQVTAQNSLNQNMRYVLVEDHKLCSGEIIPVDDPRFVNMQQSSTYVLREERTAHVAFHHEEVPAQITDQTITLLEMAGKYMIPPARCEMMYNTEFRGHSGTFHLNVVDEKK